MTTSHSPPASDTAAEDETKLKAAFQLDGITIGSISLFLSFLGSSLTIPYLQSQRDKLGCNVLCYGSMQSARSGLSMVGLVLVGRLSDRIGRTKVMWIGLFASLFSYAVNIYGTDLTSMWLALIPVALLNHNFNVMKALFADYCSNYGYSESQRASAIGKLGMVAGLSFMLGPMLGTSVLGSYLNTTYVAVILTLLSGSMLLFLPVSNSESNSVKNTAQPIKTTQQPVSQLSIKESIVSFFYMPAIQSPGARLLLFMRCFMALAFYVFMTIWTVSLKKRFDFGAKDHAYFMGWIGLWYAVSQGLLARLLIRFCAEDPTWLILMCSMCLGLGRIWAMMTSSLVMVYAIMACVIIALGVINTTISTDCSRLAGKDQVGGLYGVFEAVEGFAGLIGPSIGGLLFTVNPHLPLASVVAAYACVCIGIVLYYRKHIVQLGQTSVDDKQKED
ncbi:MFS transporter [archaeon]|nr:MAG: MFS transporter [archaeon]